MWVLIAAGLGLEDVDSVLVLHFEALGGVGLLDRVTIEVESDERNLQPLAIAVRPSACAAVCCSFNS